MSSSGLCLLKPFVGLRKEESWSVSLLNLVGTMTPRLVLCQAGGRKRSQRPIGFFGNGPPNVDCFCVGERNSITRRTVYCADGFRSGLRELSCFGDRGPKRGFFCGCIS